MNGSPRPYNTSASQKNLSFSNCELIPMFQTLSTQNKVIRLRDKLFSVLYCLANNQDMLVSRDQLIDQCWDGNYYTGTQAVTHTIYHLRALLKQNKIDASITTLSKQGYLFSCGEQIIYLDSTSSDIPDLTLAH